MKFFVSNLENSESIPRSGWWRSCCESDSTSTYGRLEELLCTRLRSVARCLIITSLLFLFFVLFFCFLFFPAILTAYCGKVFDSHFCLFVWTWQGVWQIDHLCLDPFSQTKSDGLLLCGKEIKFRAFITLFFNVKAHWFYDENPGRGGEDAAQSRHQPVSERSAWQVLARQSLFSKEKKCGFMKRNISIL